MTERKDSGVVNIHGKEYLTVAKRVSDFREEHRHKFSIETELVDRTEKDVFMKATIRELATGNVVATGHAEESRTASTINKTSALENAETSAIGRALAAFGLAGTEFASADEVAQAISQQGRPTPDWVPSDNAASEKQLQLLRDLMRQAKIDDKAITMKLGTIETKAQASDAIQKMKDKLESRDEQS